MTPYLTSMDTISQSRTVFRDIGLQSFLGLTLTFDPYMTPNLTSVNTIFLSRTVLEIMPVTILKVEQNGGF